MLKERVQYKEGLPVNCYAVGIEDYPIHFHDDLEVAYVLDGSVILKNGYYTYTMKKGDIFILNDREIHSYYNNGEPNVVMILQLDLTYFCKYFEVLKNNFFITDMEDAEDESLERLRDILARILLESLNSELGYEKKVIESTHVLIDCLIRDFQYFAMEDGKFINEAKNKWNKILIGRINRITDYMYNNYARRLTLNEIAECEHLSIFYLSHIIKEATGLSFQDFLGFIRVEESEKLLLGSSKKIGTISVECGFSAVRYYIKCFTKWFGMHPAEYRDKYTSNVRSRKISAHIYPTPQDQILKVIRQQSKDVYEGVIRNKSTVITTEINVEESIVVQSLYDDPIVKLLCEEQLKPVAGALNLLLELGEEQIASNPNYIITRPVTYKGYESNDSYSILLINLGETSALLKRINSLSLIDMLSVVSSYTGRIEVLIKLMGLSGEYRVARYQLSKESIISCYQKALGEKESWQKRERLINNWCETPRSDVKIQLASEGLFVQSYLSGFSSELILIDRV